MGDDPTYGQREYMRHLVAKLGRNQDTVCAAYADGERLGLVDRKKNSTGHSPEGYAVALWRDGERKGWL